MAKRVITVNEDQHKALLQILHEVRRQGFQFKMIDALLLLVENAMEIDE